MTSSLAYGYLRLNDADRQQLRRLRREVAAYCAREGLMLENVFADVGAPTDDVVRPGWTALLDRLVPAEAETMVVVPSLDHLSQDPTRLASMQARIYALGRRMTVMAPAAEGDDEPPDVGR